MAEVSVVETDEVVKEVGGKSVVGSVGEIAEVVLVGGGCEEEGGEIGPITVIGNMALLVKRKGSKHLLLSLKKDLWNR